MLSRESDECEIKPCKRTSRRNSLCCTIDCWLIFSRFRWGGLRSNRNISLAIEWPRTTLTVGRPSCMSVTIWPLYTPFPLLALFLSNLHEALLDPRYFKIKSHSLFLKRIMTLQKPLCIIWTNNHFLYNAFEQESCKVPSKLNLRLTSRLKTGIWSRFSFSPHHVCMGGTKFLDGRSPTPPVWL